MEKIRFARYCETPPWLLQLLPCGLFFLGLDFGNVLNYMSYFHQVVLFSFLSSAPKARAAMKE